MISPTSNLSLENTSIPDRICDAIITASKAITSITVADLPRIWNSIVEGFKNIGQTLMQQIKDFIFNDLPGLVKDIIFIVANLIKKEFEQVYRTAHSALKHLKNILEVLSLIPLFSVVCSILLAAIYFCERDWLNAVCALL